jgi:hypothetical protein
VIENIARRTKLQPCGRSVEVLCGELQNLSGIVTPAQIHHYIKTFEQYARTVIGARFELGIEIAEDFGPVPGGYISLLFDFFIECAMNLSSIGEGRQSVQLHLSEVRRHTQFSYIVTEIKFRASAGVTVSRLSEELSQVRRLIEEYCGALSIDAAFDERITLRVLLPVISWSF